MVKQKISGLCVAFALLMLIGSVVFPHHHHGNMLCFSTKCVGTCCHHHDHEGECNEIASHHHDHTSDETVLYAPYSYAEHPRIISELSVDYRTAIDMSGPGVSLSLLLAAPVPTLDRLAVNPGVPLPKPPFSLQYSRRGPPVA